MTEELRMERPSILLADDHQMFAEGLKSLLAPRFDLLGIANDGPRLVELACQHQPDIIITDISMPNLNGLDSIAKLKEIGCDSAFICLTMHGDPVYAARAIRAGASAYVLKQSATDELLTAVADVLEGKIYIATSLKEATYRMLSDVEATCAEKHLLTRRQREVLQLFAEGHSAKEVARLLHISSRTADNHKAQIMKIANLSSSAELVQLAIRLGLISVS